jgi:Glu-tRNA(Gln) amidotransferase subunit E-like FAD-binding protein
LTKLDRGLITALGGPEMSLKYFSIRQLRERQNGLRNLKFYDMSEEQERQDELIKIQEELERRGSVHPEGSNNPMENIHET